MCREIYYPSDYLGPDGKPIADVVEHHPLMSGRVNAEFYPGLVEPGDIIMRKTGFSAVAAGNLLEILADHGCDTVVMGGLTTPICVGTTSDGLSMAGFKVVILEDACASQPFDGFSAKDAHAFSLARFRYQFGQTMATNAVPRVRRRLVCSLANASSLTRLSHAKVRFAGRGHRLCRSRRRMAAAALGVVWALEVDVDVVAVAAYIFGPPHGVGGVELRRARAASARARSCASKPRLLWRVKLRSSPTR